MALELVDQKQITILDVVKAVVDEKLFAPGYGIIDLITVMDVHVPVSYTHLFFRSMGISGLPEAGG